MIAVFLYPINRLSFAVMLKIGEHNELKALRETSVGFYLGDEEGNDVLLPNKYVPETFAVDDMLEVYLYKDSEDRIIATTLAPRIQLNSFASLKAVAVDRVGAFFDMGLEKDLLVPFKEQNGRITVGEWYIVYLYLDEETDRLVGSTKWSAFCEKEDVELDKHQKVRLIIGEKTDLGRNVLIDMKYKGLIYENEIFKEIHSGDRVIGYVKEVRSDNKIDVSLQEEGHGNVTAGAQELLDYLEEHNGFMKLTDKSSPEQIKSTVQMSKKTFKRALGALYKQRLVTLSPEGVKLVKK